jgi:hypothetical protein
LLYMRLSWSHDLSHEVCGLTRLTRVFFNYFFNFILQHWIDWELNFIIFFQFAFYRVTLVSSPGFDSLTRVELSNYFVLFCIWFYFLFKPSILDWLKIESHNFFYLISMRLLQSYNSSRKLRWLTWVFFFIFF